MTTLSGVTHPKGPDAPSLTTEVRAKEMNRGVIKSVVDEALLSVPGELDKRAAMQAAAADRRKQLAASGEATSKINPGDATPDVIAAVQEVSRLLGGTLQDQTDARVKLKALADSLQAKPTATAATPPK